MKLKCIAVLLLAAGLTAGCTTTPSRGGELRIDSSSVESAERSYQAMMRGRSEAEKQKLALAMLLLNLQGVKSAYEVVANPELQSPSIGRIKDQVAGMTADEIIALAARVSDIQVEVSGQ